jgi:hypothetical protein
MTQTLNFVILNISFLFSFGKYYHYCQHYFLEIKIVVKTSVILLVITIIIYVVCEFKFGAKSSHISYELCKFSHEPTCFITENHLQRFSMLLIISFVKKGSNSYFRNNFLSVKFMLWFKNQLSIITGTFN